MSDKRSFFKRPWVIFISFFIVAGSLSFISKSISEFVGEAIDARKAQDWQERYQATVKKIRSDLSENRKSITVKIRGLIDQKKYDAALIEAKKYEAVGDAEIVSLIEQAKTAKKEDELLTELASLASTSVVERHEALKSLSALSTIRAADYERQAKVLEPQAKRLIEIAKAKELKEQERILREQTKILKEQDRARRIVLADSLDTVFLKNGFNVTVTTQGADNDVLVLTYVLFTRALVYRFTNGSGDLVGPAKAKGFKKVIFRTGHGESWEF